MTGRERTIVPILLYHSISTEPEPWIAEWSVSPATFARHMELVVESGRNAITVSDLCAALRQHASLPPSPVVITFDDGFADFAEAAAVLAANKLPSTLYVTTGALGGRRRPPDMAIPEAPMLDWSQLAELEEQGVEIGGHTHTHRPLDTMRDGVVADDIQCSKELLEEALGHAVPSFAYPFGFQRERTHRIVKSAGHTSACAVMNALSSDAANMFALARLTITPSTRIEDVQAWLAGRGARVAPYREGPRTKLYRLYRQVGGPWPAPA